MDTEHLSCAERRVSGLAVGDGRFFRAMVAPALKMSLSFKHMHVGGVLSVQVCMPCRKLIHRLDVQLCVQGHEQAY